MLAVADNDGNTPLHVAAAAGVDLAIDLIAANSIDKGEFNF